MITVWSEDDTDNNKCAVPVFCCFCCIIVYVDVTLDLKASSDGASVVVAGRLFQSCSGWKE